MDPHSVVIVDPHPVMRLSLEMVLETSGGFEVVASGSSSDEIAPLGELHRPDLLVTEILGPGDAIDAIAKLRSSDPRVAIVAFTDSDLVDHALRALDAGAAGYVLKNATDRTSLVEACTTVLLGGSFVTPTFAGRLLASTRSSAPPKDPAVRLSSRENQVAGQLLLGRTNKEIARHLRISDKTVKHYMTFLMQKLGARNRVEAVVAAQRLRF